MGSYDSGESYTPPAPPRRRSESPAPSRGGDAIGAAARAPVPQAEYDPQLKTIVALGGGLTPDRIVQPVPEEIRDGTLRDVVKYLMGDSVATRSEDRAVVEAVQSRMAAANYRLIINSTLNVSNSRLDDSLIKYLTVKTHQGEDGDLKFNFADIAIVSHDEGGLPLEYRL